MRVRLPKIFLYAFTLTFGVFTGFVAVAWTGPTGTAPNNNTDAPINVGSTAQSKAGGLVLNTGGATNGLIVYGSVGINTASPSYALHIASSSWPNIGLLKNGIGTWILGASDTTNGFNITLNASTLFTISTAGVVGVGNTSPSGASLVVGSHNGQSGALISARGNTNGNDLEFGHLNPAGYGSTLGHDQGGGPPFLCFSCEAGTSMNTYRTRGLVGSILKGDLAGGFQWGKVANANADNQSLTQTMYLSSAGALTVAGDICSNSSGRCLSTVNGGPIIFGGFYEWNGSNGTCQINNPWTGSCSCPAYAPNARYSMLASACCTFTEYQYICTN